MVMYFILGMFGVICLVHLVRATGGVKGSPSGESFFEDAENASGSEFDINAMHYDPTNHHYMGRVAPDPGGLHDDAFGDSMEVGHDHGMGGNFGDDMHDAGGGLSDPFDSQW
jgi:hypothetical protein